MHTIERARLWPEKSMDEVAERAPQSNGRGSSAEVRGRALVFYDPDRPGQKLNAIDTDQITPSAYCVSTSLEKLDEKWKTGAFKYLMPNFRERVHAGENFIVAGERFAIGSSREMSPAGLKAIAEEVGLEMVIICGENMGDIFRKNALNLGLHVAQSQEAVADAEDGDTFTFNPETRALSNVTKGQTYAPIPLTAKEEEIRDTGGIFAVGRREFRESILREPAIVWPDAATARGMTTTEQIIWAHRVDKNATVKPGATLRVYADLLPASDGTAPFSIHTFNQISGGHTIFPRQIAVASDHFVFTGKESDDLQTEISRQFVAQQGIKKPYIASPGDGIFHFYFPEQGLVYPGQFIPGADSHSRAYGAYGAVGFGVGSTTLGFGWATGYVYFTVAKQRRVVFDGALQPWVSGKDIVLALLAHWGSKQAQGMSVEFVDKNRQLPIAYRNTIANMMAEGEAQNGIFAADDITYDWFDQKGMKDLPYPRLAPGEDAQYDIDEVFDLGSVEPMIARPFSPGNAHPAEEVAKEKIKFDKAFIGSCTNGSYNDLLQAALVIVAAREKGYTRAATEFVIFPGSGGVRERIRVPDPRLAGESIAAVFESVGGEIRQSWCGPCFGQGPDALEDGQVAITTFNRNWQNRMGIGGQGYLASPPVVAASALAGYMAPPSALGLSWDAERYGI